MEITGNLIVPRSEAAAYAATNSRIDNIVAQAGNDNTEIVDARIACADGQSKTNLSARLSCDFGAVREQYTQVKTAVDQLVSAKTLADYCQTEAGKTIGTVSGSYRIVDSETDQVVYLSVAELFAGSKTLMVGSTNYSVKTFLFLDEDKNILGNVNSEYLRKDTFTALAYASDCVWAAVAFPQSVVPDISVVSCERFTPHLDRLLNEKGTNLLNGEYSHGYFQTNNVGWNEGYRSTNIFEIPAGASISFNAPITQSRSLVFLDENLAYSSRTSVSTNQQGQCIYTNNGNTKLYGYISSKIETYPVQTPDIAVIGTYSTTELNQMSSHELNDHLPQSLLPYDLSFALVSQNLAKTGYYGKTFSGLGDSLTAAGSGGTYLTLIKNALGLSKYQNCGDGGTRVSGSGNDAFWQDSRVEALDIDSTVITIMGGTNDAPFITVSDSDFTFDNCDTDNFVGAYNVLLSKIFYKFLKRTAGFYQTVDYSNLTQVGTVDPDFRVILITPPQRLDSDANNLAAKTTGEYVKRIGQMWGIPVVDAYGEMQMNKMTYTEGRADQVHFANDFHKKLAEIIIGKLRLLNPV